MQDLNIQISSLVELVNTIPDIKEFEVNFSDKSEVAVLLIFKNKSQKKFLTLSSAYEWIEKRYRQ